MSYAAKVKYSLASCCSLPPSVQSKDKNERAPTNDFKLNQDVMYLDPTSKKWFPATIVCLLDAKRSYLIKTPEGAEYRRTQQHLKPYKPKVCLYSRSEQTQTWDKSTRQIGLVSQQTKMKNIHPTV